MPFSGSAYAFTQAGAAVANPVGAVYGLFRWQPGRYICLYVGKTDNLRRRLAEHLNNPPIAGITHWFAEAHETELRRTAREAMLITEFQPPGNTVGRR